jgi:enamine deaminase RidA (YjgF/YER057c/UK114 family)
MTTQERIHEIGIEIPQAAKPIANYVGARIVKNMVFVSGQLPMKDGQLQYIGKVGKEVSVQDAVKAAELCTINILAQLSSILSNNLDSVESCVKIGVFVNSTPEFEDHSIVANGASDLIVKIFADAGLHARAAVGVASLPKNVSVEVEAIFTINPRS